MREEGRAAELDFGGGDLPVERYSAGGLGLAEGCLLLALGGERPGRLTYDRVEPSGAGGFAASVSREGFELRSDFAPAPAASPSGGWEVRTVLAARSRLELRSLVHAYDFASEPGRLDFAWLPNLKSGPGEVAGQHVFRSPCVILRRGCLQAALAPRIGPDWRPAALPRFLDLEAAGGAGGRARFAFGLADHEPRAHVFYRLTGRPALLEPGEEVELAFTLLFDAEADEFAHRAALRFLWDRYGERELAQRELAQRELGGRGPERLGDLARAAYGFVFERSGLWAWTEAPGGAPEAGGKPRLGALMARTVRPSLDPGSLPLPNDISLSVALNYLASPSLRLKDKLALARSSAAGRLDMAWNGIFFNSVRTAFGAEYYGRLWGDAELREKARAMRELALAAPSAGGIFPAVLVAPGPDPRWVPGTRVWRFSPGYGSADAAWTCRWMLLTRACLGDEGGRLLERCARLGDFLERVQLPSGAVPTWLDVGPGGRVRPRPELRESAASAASGAFLARLARELGGEEGSRAREAAIRVAEFLVRDVFPRSAWQDQEVYYSCSPKGLTWRDGRTGIPPQGSLCLSWAAELLGMLARDTGQARWANYGRSALDLLLLYQQIWSPPFIGFDAAGGFGVMNTDSEWSDARQAEFALLLMDWYDLTGEEELFRRGAAALRASFELLRRTGRPWGQVAADDPEAGALPENYGHAGRDARIPGYIMPDWGAGTAASAAALARARRGDLYVDAARGRAFALDGCSVRSAGVGPGRLELDLSRELSPEGVGGPLRLVVAGAASAGTSIRVDGRELGTFGPGELAAGIDF